MFGRVGRPLLLLTLVLLAPVVPFLLWGQWLEAWVRGLFEPQAPATVTMALIVAALATDVLLPAPSSFISTVAGAQLGILLGTAASWTGMTLGGVIGFALAKRWGRPLAMRLASAEDIARMDAAAARAGPAVIVMTRAAPVLAEACVLWMGMIGLPWQRFLPALALSNLGLALAYSAFGDVASDQAWLPTALAVSIAAPLALTAVGRRVLGRRR